MPPHLWSWLSTYKSLHLAATWIKRKNGNAIEWRSNHVCDQAHFSLRPKPNVPPKSTQLGGTENSKSHHELLTYKTTLHSHNVLSFPPLANRENKSTYITVMKNKWKTLRKLQTCRALSAKHALELPWSFQAAIAPPPSHWLVGQSLHSRGRCDQTTRRISTVKWKRPISPRYEFHHVNESAI